MICESCGKEIDDNRTSCPDCGTECQCGGNCGSNSYSDLNEKEETGFKKVRNK